MQVDISNNFLEELQEGIFTCVPSPHSVDFEGFDASDIRGLRDQVCTTQGCNVDCVRQLDF